jgi:hypothetical protein
MSYKQTVLVDILNSESPARILKKYEYQESIINKNKRMWDSSLTLGMTEY